jgi:hypothetical protein
MTTFRGAVLIVGSLWWDKSGIRDSWRKNRLKVDKKQLVYAPIRYGRKSGESRKNTYTMVFSLSCIEKMLGTALLVPFQRPIESLSDLIIEAQKLWEAEGGKPDRVRGTWGGVGLLVNPAKILPDGFVNDWKDFFHLQPSKPTFVLPPGETSPLTEDGILMIEWVKDAETNQPVDFDFILAAVIDPQSRRYPSSNEIAQACLDNNYTLYFDNNRINGITTFQDDEILELLNK